MIYEYQNAFGKKQGLPFNYLGIYCKYSNKNKMKKIASFFATAAFVVALSSCGSKTTETTGVESTTETTVTEELPNSDATITTETTTTVDSTMEVKTDTSAH